ncbi:MAG: hypothetical protein AAGA90_21915 [Actinomycetota bacterium]
MELTRSQRVMIAIAAVAVAVAVAAYDAENAETEPVAIVDARLGSDDLVQVVVDRCESAAAVERTSLDGDRLVVEVAAEPGSGDCQDVVDVAVITDDILELEDAVSGEVFTLRVVEAERATRPPGTRE